MIATTTNVHGFREQDPSFATRIIHSAQEPEQWSDGNPVVMPISLTTTFKQQAPGQFVVWHHFICHHHSSYINSNLIVSWYIYDIICCRVTSTAG